MHRKPAQTDKKGTNFAQKVTNMHTHHPFYPKPPTYTDNQTVNKQRFLNYKPNCNFNKISNNYLHPTLIMETRRQSCTIEQTQIWNFEDLTSRVDQTLFVCMRIACWKCQPKLKCNDSEI